jgi:hypothetical protein
MSEPLPLAQTRFLLASMGAMAEKTMFPEVWMAVMTQYSNMMPSAGRADHHHCHKSRPSDLRRH